MCGLSWRSTVNDIMNVMSGHSMSHPMCDLHIYIYNGLPDGEIFYHPYGSVVCLKYENQKYTGWKVSY